MVSNGRESEKMVIEKRLTARGVYGTIDKPLVFDSDSPDMDADVAATGRLVLISGTTRIRSRLRRICHQPRWVEWPRIADANKAEDELVVRGPTA